MANRFMKPRSDVIVYNVRKSGEGWRVEVKLPKRISPEDRISVLNNLWQYKVALIANHPTWFVRFGSGENAYTLDVIPANRASKDLVK